MKHCPTALTLMAPLLLLLTPAPAAADGLYFGGGWGRSSFGVDLDVLGQTRTIDETAKGWKLFGGVSEGFFGFEGGYRDFGTVKTDVAGVNVESGTTAWDAAALGRVRVPVVDFFAKAGAMWWSRNTKIGGAGGDTTGTDFFWGVGAGLHVAGLGVRVEWEWVKLDAPDKLSMVSVSGTLGF